MTDSERLRIIAKHVAIYTIENEDEVYMIAFGERIVKWSQGSRQGVALLKLDAVLRPRAKETSP